MESNGDYPIIRAFNKDTRKPTNQENNRKITEEQEKHQVDDRNYRR